MKLFRPFPTSLGQRHPRPLKAFQLLDPPHAKCVDVKNVKGTHGTWFFEILSSLDTAALGTLRKGGQVRLCKIQRQHEVFWFMEPFRMWDTTPQGNQECSKSPEALRLECVSLFLLCFHKDAVSVPCFSSQV